MVTGSGLGSLTLVCIATPLIRATVAKTKLSSCLRTWMKNLNFSPSRTLHDKLILAEKVGRVIEMPDKEPEKKSKGDESGDGDGKTGETDEIETEGKGHASRPKVVSGLKAGLSKGDFDRVVGTRIRVCRRGSRKWSCGRIYSYDCIGKKHCITYEDGDTEEIDLTRREFVLASRSSEFQKYRSVDLQAKRVEPKMTEVASRWKSGKKPRKEKRQQRQREEEMAKANLTRTPAATFKSVELDERTSAKVIRKRVKVYSFDEDNWLIGRIMSYDESLGHHLVAFEGGNTTEMDLQTQLCMVELRYEEATALLNSSSHECHCF